MIKGDPLSRVLFVDLSLRRYWIEEREDLFEERLGGAGVAIRLLQEECKSGAEPLSPGNAIVLAVGPLSGVFPLASKTVAMFKSPLTGNLGESHAGGRSAVAIRLAGYGAIVIKGASDTPVYLAIQGDRVNFRDASVLWGMQSSVTVGRVIRERESGGGIRAIMRIGGAGEKLVSYASVVTETYRHFGRLGLGAVFGSKKLKAVMVQGKRAVKVGDAKLCREAYKEIYDAVTQSPVMKKYHDLGTPMNVGGLNELKALPTQNLKRACFKAAHSISGEVFAEGFLGRRVACAHCPVACIHLAALRLPYEDEPYFYKTLMISYDYELIYALGSLLEVDSAEGVLRLIEAVETFGLDAMSSGVALAWATEAQERGLITEEETAGLKLRWSDFETYIKALQLVVEQPNEFYAALARGVGYASSTYGGQDFALVFGGNEMPGYHTGPAVHIGYLTGARHSHLDGAGYSIDEKAAASGRSPTAVEIADGLLEEERWRQILSSLVVCFFARGIYRPDVVRRALRVMGFELKSEDLMRRGAEILKSKHEYKVQEGFDFSKIRVPKRILETPTPLGYLTEDLIMDGVEAYAYRVMSSQ